MSNLFWLTDAQMARLELFFPKSHGKPRVDDRRVPSVPVMRGVFARMMHGLAAETTDPKTVMIDVSKRTPCVRVSLRKCLKAHRTATSLRAKGGACDQRARLIGRTKGGMNTKLHADADGRPIRVFGGNDPSNS